MAKDKYPAPTEGYPVGLELLIRLGISRGVYVYADENGGLHAASYRHSRAWFRINSGHVDWAEAVTMLRGALRALPQAPSERCEKVLNDYKSSPNGLVAMALLLAVEKMRSDA